MILGLKVSMKDDHFLSLQNNSKDQVFQLEVTDEENMIGKAQTRSRSDMENFNLDEEVTPYDSETLGINGRGSWEKLKKVLTFISFIVIYVFLWYCVFLVCIPRCVWTLCVVQAAASIRNEYSGCTVACSVY